MSTDPDTRQLYTELGYLRGAMSTMKDAILSHEEGLHDLQAERDRLRAENARLRAASDHRKVNKWDALCADVGIDPDSTISTVREAIERDAECGIQCRGEDLTKWLKEVDEHISKLAATTATPRHKLYDYAVLPDGRVVPYEEAKHLKDGAIPPRLTVHKLNVAPVGSWISRGMGSNARRKDADGKWHRAWMFEGQHPESSEDLIANGWADATLRLPEAP